MGILMFLPQLCTMFSIQISLSLSLSWVEYIGKDWKCWPSFTYWFQSAFGDPLDKTWWFPPVLTRAPRWCCKNYTISWCYLNNNGNTSHAISPGHFSLPVISQLLTCECKLFIFPAPVCMKKVRNCSVVIPLTLHARISISFQNRTMRHSFHVRSKHEETGRVLLFKPWLGAHKVVEGSEWLLYGLPFPCSGTEHVNCGWEKIDGFPIV